MRPFGCIVTILNTIDHLGKFDGKAGEGFFIGYSLNSKAFIVFNSRTRLMEENLHISFGTQSNGFTSKKAGDNVGQARKETTPVKDYILLPLWIADLPFSQDPKSSHDDGFKPSSDDRKKVDENQSKESECNDQENEDNVNITNNVKIVNVAGINEVNVIGGKTSIELPFDLNMHALEDVSIFKFLSDDEDDGAMADMNNLDTIIQISPILTTRIHKDHPLDQVIRDLQSATQTRKMSKNLKEHGFIEEEVYVCQRLGFEDLDFPDRVYKELCIAFEKMVHEKSQMSSMGELTFLLGLQVKQKKDGTFISQDKYVAEILKKFRKPKRKDTQVPQPSDPIENVVDEVVYKELGDSLVRAATIDFSLGAEKDSDEEITLVSVQNDADKEMFNVDALNGKEVFVPKQEVVVKKVNDEVQNVVEEVVEVINNAKLIIDATQISATGDIVSTASTAVSAASVATTVSVATTTTAIIATDDVHAKIDADHQLSERMQEKEQEDMSITEKATLFQQPLEKRRKHFAAKREEEKRNKLLTKAQQRMIMCSYLKNMEGYKLKDLKLKEFDSI
uniref:Copia protein n=1 Tax=Tanacetum cinerariifolium TaxID=118510 RepID=A0A6L2JFM2_TANCI|nr:copia protein [Tanacetum cinerariifolium]